MWCIKVYVLWDSFRCFYFVWCAHENIFGAAQFDCGNKVQYGSNGNGNLYVYA